MGPSTWKASQLTVLESGTAWSPAYLTFRAPTQASGEIFQGKCQFVWRKPVGNCVDSSGKRGAREGLGGIWEEERQAELRAGWRSVRGPDTLLHGPTPFFVFSGLG